MEERRGGRRGGREGEGREEGWEATACNFVSIRQLPS